MANEGLQLKAIAHVKLTKLDNITGEVSVEEHEVNLTDEEAKALWLSQQQA